jgi:7-keto-8-aminopelargonate synthetase-like enzyme
MIPPATPDTDRAVLDDDAIDYLRTDGFDLLARWERHGAFWDARLATGLDPSSRTVADRGDGVARVLTRGHEAMTGIDLSSRDPLSLAHHPRLRAVAIEAASRWGVHAAGPLSSQGGSPPLIRLEERIAETLCYAEAVIFPTRWASGQGTIRALVRPSDHVVIDADSSSGLLDGAATATANVHRLPECSPEAAGAVLARIRARDARIGILVVAQTLSERDSTVADIAGLRDVCRSWNANLLVDISGDFGAMGDGGLGVLGAQGMIGEVDVVVGSLSPTFAANGGFAAAASPGIRQALVIFAAA